MPGAGKLPPVASQHRVSSPRFLAPTIASLYETEWYSVEVVVNQGEVRTLIPRLIRAGAQGIVEYPLHKVI